ncbi:MAG TPA: hypothetical protein VF624_13310 [Tepidisphaeraceae bacterium]
MPVRPAPPRSIRLRFVAWIGIIVALLVGMPAWFFLLRGQRILHQDALLIGGWAIAAGLILCLWGLLRSTPPTAIRLREKTSFWCVLLGAAWLHLHALLWLAPALSDDVLRYRLDGLQWNGGRSPYLGDPSGVAVAAAPPNAVDVIDFATPFADVPTIYLPVSQAVFAALRRIDMAFPPAPWPAGEREEWSLRELIGLQTPMPRLYVWRVAFAGAMLAATAALMGLLRRRGRSLWYAALFAWHPLAVIETAGMAHQDAVGILLAAAAWLAWDAAGRVEAGPAEPPQPAAVNGKRPRARPAALARVGGGFALPAAGVLLALAVGVKPIAGIVAAFWFIARPRAAWVVPMLVTLALVMSPLLYQQGYVGFLETLRSYTRTWEANGSIYELILTQVKPVWTWGFELFIDTSELGRMVAAIGSAAVGIACVRRRATWESAYYALCLAGLLLGPIAYPWYLLWPLAVVPLLPRGGLTLLVFSTTVGISYALWHTPDWKLPAWMSLLEYLPVYLALLIEWRWFATASAPSARGA